MFVESYIQWTSSLHGRASKLQGFEVVQQTGDDDDAERFPPSPGSRHCARQFEDDLSASAAERTAETLFFESNLSELFRPLIPKLARGQV